MIQSFADDNSIGPTSLQDELRLQHDSMRVISDQTGGFAVINRNDYADGFARIQRENSNYYVLGYYPLNEKRDGKFRTISVKVRKPGLSVRARSGYVAPRGKSEAPKLAPGTTTQVVPYYAAPADAADGNSHRALGRARRGGGEVRRVCRGRGWGGAGLGDRSLRLLLEDGDNDHGLLVARFQLHVGRPRFVVRRRRGDDMVARIDGNGGSEGSGPDGITITLHFEARHAACAIAEFDG